MSQTFLYFAYGSNLLRQRIHINSPSAVRREVGRLKDYKLLFTTYSKRWRGTSATIAPAKNSEVWGAIWEIESSHLSNLDKQEGVHKQIYFGFTADVETPEGKILQCRVYQQCNIPEDDIPLEKLPIDRRPSPLYLQTIVRGAVESGLPKDYIAFLEKIPHNEYQGDYEIT